MDDALSITMPSSTSHTAPELSEHSFVSSNYEFLKNRLDAYNTLAVVSALMAAFTVTLVCEIDDSDIENNDSIVPIVFSIVSPLSIMCNIFTLSTSSYIYFQGNYWLGCLYLDDQFWITNALSFFLNDLYLSPCICLSTERLITIYFFVGSISSIGSFFVYTKLKFESVNPVFSTSFNAVIVMLALHMCVSFCFLQFSIRRSYCKARQILQRERTIHSRA